MSQDQVDSSVHICSHMLCNGGKWTYRVGQESPTTGPWPATGPWPICTRLHEQWAGAHTRSLTCTSDKPACVHMHVHLHLYKLSCVRMHVLAGPPLVQIKLRVCVLPNSPLPPLRTTKPQRLGTTGVGDQATYDLYAIARNNLIFCVFVYLTHRKLPHILHCQGTPYSEHSLLCVLEIQRNSEEKNH